MPEPDVVYWIMIMLLTGTSAWRDIYYIYSIFCNANPYLKQNIAFKTPPPLPILELNSLHY